MARTVLTPVTLTRGTVDVTTKYTSITTSVVSNGIKVLYKHNDHLLLHFKNSTTIASTITLKASTDDMAYNKCLGDEAIALPANSEVMIMGPDQTRFCNIVSGALYLYIDLSTGLEGTVAAIETIHST